MKLRLSLELKLRPLAPEAIMFKKSFLQARQPHVSIYTSVTYVKLYIHIYLT
jgi:hypothetical protein